MLKIKYFAEFENGYPFLVVTGDKEGFSSAHRFFSNKESAYLNEPSFATIVDITPLEQASLFLNKDECQHIAQQFKNLSFASVPSHVYFDTIALGDEIEGMISYSEYDELF